MMKSSAILCFIYVLIFCSCNAPSEINSDLDPLFDMELYLEKDVFSKFAAGQVRKTIILNGEEETKIIDSKDFTRQLDYLRDFNINKPRLLDRYKTTNLEDKIIYQALDSSLVVRRIEITQENKEVTNIIIDHKISTIFSSANKRIVMNANSIFSIHTISDSKIGNEQDLLIKWEIL